MNNISKQETNQGILNKLYSIMAEIPEIGKDKTNSFHGYKYTSEYAIKTAIHPLLVKHKVMFTTTLVDIKRETDITSIKLEYCFSDIETGEKISGVMPGEGQDKGDKGVYKAITGAIKYILTTTFLIATGDDPENDEGKLKQASTIPVNNNTRPGCVSCGWTSGKHHYSCQAYRSQS